MNGLERKLRRELEEPRCGGRLDLTKRRAGNVAVHGARAVELGMVEHVERLEAHLQRLGTTERHVLDQRHVEILDAGTVKEPARRIAKLAERRQAEARRVEPRAFRRIVVDIQIAARRVVRRVEQVVIDTVAERAQQ